MYQCESLESSLAMLIFWRIPKQNMRCIRTFSTELKVGKPGADELPKVDYARLQTKQHIYHLEQS